jgi:N-acetylglucosaminyldiphosphoundecaprenol N-acetyl-beta-D-mannosaminyltransferase
MHKVTVQGIAIESIDRSQLESLILKSVAGGRKEIFAYVNVHAMNIARSEIRFKRFLQTADHVYCDGEGVRVGAKLLGESLSPRIVLTRWILDLADLLARHGYSIFLLGGAEPTVERAAALLQRSVPGLALAGFHHGYFGGDGNRAVIEKINSVRPDVLFVGLGMPDQEYWIEENKEALQVKTIIPCGGMIDYLSGAKAAPPAWMWQHGLEWLHRFLQEPVRLWRRYLIGNPAFMISVLRERLLRARQDENR